MTQVTENIGELAGGFPGNVGASKVEAEERSCFHCGTVTGRAALVRDGKAFCCAGCLAVYELLTANGLTEFYRLGQASGVRVREDERHKDLKFLDEPRVRERLVDFADERMTRVTFRLPAIHCIACVWLLENLFRLRAGIGRSEVNFPRKQATITFETGKILLSEVASLLASLGYEPELNLADLDAPASRPVSRRLWMQIGFAGFAFGNVMLFSISTYFGLDLFSGPQLRQMFGWLSLALAVPVLFYSAADYWRAAWGSLRQGRLAIEVPIAAGIVALFAQSTFEVLAGRGEGYFDSFSGLVFFLLCGKLFQQKTYDRLVFDRDYKSFFPLSVARLNGGNEERVALSQLRVGDLIVLRHGELIPADARLSSGTAQIDYSFITGESQPAHKSEGDYLYCGGRQMGGRIVVEMAKDVSQSHLSSLWSQGAFRKEPRGTLNTLTNKYSERFTRLVIGVAVGAAIFWWFHDPRLSLKSFTSVLIVACPCALALAAPFTLGTAQRLLAQRKVFLKHAQVLETLARVNVLVFDKTGTLTAAGAAAVEFEGAVLTKEEERRVAALARQSIHPYSVRIGEVLTNEGEGTTGAIRSFAEIPGCGTEGVIDGHEVRMGSAGWLASRGVEMSQGTQVEGSRVHIAFDGKYSGSYLLMGGLRPEVEQLVKNLSGEYELALISGDAARDRDRFRGIFGGSAQLLFNQSPTDKLDFIRRCQEQGRVVMMVGDGLNDAGVLKQSDVGVAVMENINSFSPASDVIMKASTVARLHNVLRFSKRATRVVRLSFLISSVYNVVGLSIAARGLLSPVVCAILMPLSSVTVVAFACGVTSWLGNRVRVGEPGRARPRSRSEAGSADLQLIPQKEGVA